MSAGLGAAQVNQPAPATKQKTAPSQIEILNVPLPVRAVEDDAEKKARDAIQKRTEDRERNDLLAQEGMKVAADRMADYSRIQTWLIGIGTFLLFVTLWLTRQANQAAQAAVTVTREIGEAQVRAYVSIKTAAIYFGGDTAMPFVVITAANSGQSPARNFVWTTEIRYLTVDENGIESEAWPEWLGQPGVDIHSSGEAPAMKIDHDFALVEKIAKWKTLPNRVGVSVTIHYAWLDVFGRLFVDLASFQGVAEAGNAEENRRKIHDLNTSAWACELHSIPKGQAWSGIAVAAQEDDKGSEA
jgi:hypothetical protein